MEYSKGDAFREAGEAKKARPEANDNGEPSKEPLSGYTKGEGTVPPRSFVVIFSGGNVREPDYFKLVELNPSLFRHHLQLLQNHEQFYGYTLDASAPSHQIR